MRLKGSALCRCLAPDSYRGSSVSTLGTPSTLKALLKSTGSPLSRIHLLRILTVCSEKRYLRLTRRIMVRMLGDTGAAESRCLQGCFDWVEAESGAWSAGGLSNHIRLAMVWAHAHFCIPWLSVQEHLPWVTEVFRNLSGNPSLELFRREPSYWFDVSHRVK